VIIGTAAFASNDALATFVEALGDALVVAVDVRDGVIATRGWLASEGLSVADAVARCQAAGVIRLHATAIDRDGTMGGPDLGLYETLCASGLKVVAAGGVRNDDDVAALAAVGCEGAVMGTAFAQRFGLL
jgi:phosphoribosylformimino-5-aminoimidazole carboxamide ribotide isomerase